MPIMESWWTYESRRFWKNSSSNLEASASEVRKNLERVPNWNSAKFIQESGFTGDQDTSSDVALDTI